jgi:hypothetical protein
MFAANPVARFRSEGDEMTVRHADPLSVHVEEALGKSSYCLRETLAELRGRNNLGGVL